MTSSSGKIVQLFPKDMPRAKAIEALTESIQSLPTDYLTLALKVAADELLARAEEMD